MLFWAEKESAVKKTTTDTPAKAVTKKSALKKKPMPTIAENSSTPPVSESESEDEEMADEEPLTQAPFTPAPNHPKRKFAVNIFKDKALRRGQQILSHDCLLQHKLDGGWFFFFSWLGISFSPEQLLNFFLRDFPELSRTKKFKIPHETGPGKKEKSFTW